jgi:hypothetical protein
VNLELVHKEKNVFKEGKRGLKRRNGASRNAKRLVWTDVKHNLGCFACFSTLLKS